MRLASLRSFLVDLALAGAAGALNFHPVADWLRARPFFLSCALDVAHIVLVPLLFSQVIGGHASSDDLLRQNRTSGHERAWVWSMVGMMGTSFVVPFACALFLRRTAPLPLAMAAVFAPLFAFVGPAMALLASPRLAQSKWAIPNLFATRPRRIAVAAMVTSYLALTEVTMFLCAESKAQAAGTAVFLGLFLSYLPIRLFLFYSTADDRRAIVSVLASFAFVALQISVASPA